VTDLIDSIAVLAFGERLIFDDSCVRCYVFAAIGASIRVCKGSVDHHHGTTLGTVLFRLKCQLKAIVTRGVRLQLSSFCKQECRQAVQPKSSEVAVRVGHASSASPLVRGFEQN